MNVGCNDFFDACFPFFFESALLISFQGDFGADGPQPTLRYGGGEKHLLSLDANSGSHLLMCVPRQ